MNVGDFVAYNKNSKDKITNIDSSKMLNFKIIQDMAEAATRSGNTQIHLARDLHRLGGRKIPLCPTNFNSAHLFTPFRKMHRIPKGKIPFGTVSFRISTN